MGGVVGVMAVESINGNLRGPDGIWSMGAVTETLLGQAQVSVAGDVGGRPGFGGPMGGIFNWSLA